MELLGVLFGLASAASQSASYVFSRLFVLERKQAALRLLVAAHLIMGLVSLLLLPLAWSPAIPPLRAYGVPLVAGTLAFLAAQFCLFMLVRETQASRMAPLLGFKIVILAGMSAAFLGQSLHMPQWIAVGLCALAALMLNAAGRALSPAALCWLLLACTGYALSDINIMTLVHCLHPVPLLRAALLGVCLSYIVAGIIALLMAPWLGGRRVLADWRYACPFAGFWYLAMVCLFACFGLIGALHGNVVQSTRGILSIALGAVLAHLGLHQLEEKVPGAVLVRRILAAVLMCAAIWLFQAGR